jgi:hypothetical protein
MEKKLTHKILKCVKFSGFFVYYFSPHLLLVGLFFLGRGAQKLFACKIYIVSPQISLKSQKQNFHLRWIMGRGSLNINYFFLFFCKKKRKVLKL